MASESQHRSCQLIGHFLQALDEEALSMSEHTIEVMQQQLYAAVSTLRGALNVRNRLLSLPVEILSQVVEEIPVLPLAPAPSLPPYWWTRFQDSSLLIPVSRTCRRLRNIAFSRGHCWGHIKSTHGAAIPRMLAASEENPLSLVIDHDDAHADGRLLETYPSITSRLRELHFFGVTYKCLRSFNRTCLDLLHPELELLSFCGDAPTSVQWHRRRLALNRDYYPRLRQVVLDGIIFRIQSTLPFLTHLFLSRINLRGLHDRIANFLSSTPNITNLVLSSLLDDGYIPDGENVPDVHLPHLRRVVLHDLASQSLRYCLSLTSRCAEGAATQIVNEYTPYGHFEFEPVLTERIKWQSATTIGIGITRGASRRATPSPAGEGHGGSIYSVTIASGVSALRIVAKAQRLSRNPETRHLNHTTWLHRILSDQAALENVQEVWLYTTLGHQSDPGQVFELRDVLSTLPSLETVVFSVTYDHATEAGDVICPLSLTCLPTFAEQHVPQKLKTIRVVLCDARSESPPSKGKGKPGQTELTSAPRTVRFLRMLEELSYKEYRYLEKLALQLTPGIQVDDADLAQLWGHFTTVSLEVIREPPGMPLPQCCVEFDEGPGGHRVWAEHYC